MTSTQWPGLMRVLVVSGLTGSASLLSAAEYPQAEITNGQIRARLYLPDAQKGYYRGTRFDGSGMIFALEYQGHNYYGPWFDRTDPNVVDFIYRGSEIVAGPCSAATGPAEEFQSNGSALGWDEAKVGGTFLKIGVGVLRKDAANYSFAKLYEIVDAGNWVVHTRRDSVVFTHELADTGSGYGYLYQKTVRLTAGKPEMVLEHRLKNTGTRTIRSSVFNHNFLVLDRQPPGPDFTIRVPFPIRSPRPPDPDLAQIRGNGVVYLKRLKNQDRVQTAVLGFGDSPKDYDVRIENTKVGAGIHITGDRPLSHNALWSIRTVLSMEPFVAMTINPGDEFTWNLTYQYYTLPSAKGAP